MVEVYEHRARQVSSLIRSSAGTAVQVPPHIRQNHPARQTIQLFNPHERRDIHGFTHGATLHFVHDAKNDVSHGKMHCAEFPAPAWYQKRQAVLTEPFPTSCRGVMKDEDGMDDRGDAVGAAAELS
ncbi:hypothetical protein ABZT07_31310, partial [Streptomyces sp. NPDC005317]|uniref:hypothetical protein n=1 Tax=Streptomyces sp. NPDC005317 TaxID=3156876 RepID=UPI0033A07CF3